MAEAPKATSLTRPKGLCQTTQDDRVSYGPDGFVRDDCFHAGVFMIQNYVGISKIKNG